MTKVLVIEDDQQVSNMYKNMLIMSGYDVNTAGDGEDGLIKARSWLPNLILLDVILPKINGLDVLKQLKADTDTQKIPVVVMTNLSAREDEEAAMASGAVKFIVKSEYEPKQISGMVAEVLAGNGS
jgi:DNA-binding response OmpR family regulator